ncbi:hypothetical protein JHK85_048481 [Glycine max]|nr:hypothetical protein JHK85_048481 [Glycine max]
MAKHMDKSGRRMSCIEALSEGQLAKHTVFTFRLIFGYGETERELSLTRKASCGALDEILRDCEVSRGGGDIPTTYSTFSTWKASLVVDSRSTMRKLSLQRNKQKRYGSPARQKHSSSHCGFLEFKNQESTRFQCVESDSIVNLVYPLDHVIRMPLRMAHNSVYKTQHA